MKKEIYLLFAILVSVLTTSCSKEEKDEPTNPTTTSTISKQDIIGTWNIVEVYSETNGVRTALPIAASQTNGDRITKMVFTEYYETMTVSYYDPYSASLITASWTQMYSIANDGFLIIPDADDSDGFVTIVNSKLEFKQYDSVNNKFKISVYAKQ